MSHGVLSVVMSGKKSEWEWKINNFSLGRNRYLSPYLKFEGESWRLMLLPNTIDGYIKLYLCRPPSGSSIIVEFSASVKTTEGTESFERPKRSCFEGNRFKRFDSFNHILQWIRRTEFSNRQGEFLSSGCLTILVTMMKAGSGESETAANSSELSTVTDHEKLLQDLRQLLLNQEHSDVVLRVKGKEFRAHKNILAIRSPVFASTFRHEMKENMTGIVDIEDCDLSVFPDFLRFLYCNDTSNLTGENVFELFTIADKYDCEDLRVKCVRFIKDNLSVETFCKALALALLHSEAELLRVATDVFIKNAGKIFKTVDWPTFAAENPTQINELFIKYVNSTTRSSTLRLLLLKTCE